MTFADLGLGRAGAQGAPRCGLRDPLGHPGSDHSDPPRGSRRRGSRADRNGQDRSVRAAHSRSARRVAEDSAGSRARADARARPAGVRGVREVRLTHEGRARPADLRRTGLRRAAVGPAPRCAHHRRHARSHHGPPRQRHARPDGAEVPRARRSRRDAEDGLRGRRRDDPRRHPEDQAGRPVLGDHALDDPPHVAAVPERPRRDHGQDQDHDLIDDHPALPDRVVPAEDGCSHPHPRGRELRGHDHLRPHEERDRRDRREAPRPRVFRRRHQR